MAMAKGSKTISEHYPAHFPTKNAYGEDDKLGYFEIDDYDNEVFPAKKTGRKRVGFAFQVTAEFEWKKNDEGISSDCTFVQNVEEFLNGKVGRPKVNDHENAGWDANKDADPTQPKKIMGKTVDDPVIPNNGVRTRIGDNKYSWADPPSFVVGSQDPYKNYTWKLEFEWSFKADDKCPCDTKEVTKSGSLEIVAKDGKVASVDWSTK
ncbi:MAG: hypothetical protein K8I27_13690 [Planctomycetes bacterium]|nr:hypothetical protein [Planctomycetota bacterium]